MIPAFTCCLYKCHSSHRLIMHSFVIFDDPTFIFCHAFCEVITFEIPHQVCFFLSAVHFVEQGLPGQLG